MEQSRTIPPKVDVKLTSPQGDQAAQGGLPPNGTFSLWQMLMAIMQYEKTVLDNSAEMQQNWAENLGGSNGIYARLYNVGCEVGVQDANSLKADAYSKFAQVGISGGSLIGSGLKYGLSTRPEINAGQAGVEDSEKMSNAINKSDAGFQIQEKGLNENIDPKVQAKVDGWADGSEKVDNFKGADAEEARLNEQAAKHVANDRTKREKVLKRVNEQKQSAQNRISQADQNFNSFQGINSTVTTALNSGAAGGGSLAQAAAVADKGKASASQSIISQVQQQVVGSQNKAEQNAQEALQQANQWASSFASAAASQVHG